MSLVSVYRRILRLFPREFYAAYGELIGDCFEEGYAESEHKTLYSIYSFCELPFLLIEETMNSHLKSKSKRDFLWNSTNVLVIGLLLFALPLGSVDYFASYAILYPAVIATSLIIGMGVFKASSNGALSMLCILGAVSGVLLEVTFQTYQNLVSSSLLLHNSLLVVLPPVAVYVYARYLSTNPTHYLSSRWLSLYGSQAPAPTWREFVTLYVILFSVGSVGVVGSTMGFGVYDSTAVLDFYNGLKVICISIGMPVLAFLFVYRRVGVRTTPLLSIVGYIGVSALVAYFVTASQQSLTWQLGPDLSVAMGIHTLFSDYLNQVSVQASGTDVFKIVSLQLLAYAIRPMIFAVLAWVSVTWPGADLSNPAAKRLRA